ncbi:MAG: peptidoglycan-binding protein [Flavobacteriaceae bacterium CG2_30_31_66]|nr:MAG: peptidoglycan-binding protein [Flavobacteriaceae bacterium CG2_30_31_66]
MKEKYQKVFDLCEKLDVKDGELKVEEGIFKLWATTKYPFEKNQIIAKIKEIGGENPTDIFFDIKAKDETVFARHYIQSLDTLSSIAETYYGNPMKYDNIFQANTDILKDPNTILSGQNLVIPFL